MKPGCLSYVRVTRTVTSTECVMEPIVAVTVTVYVPGVVNTEVETVRVDVAVPPNGANAGQETPLNP